MKKYTNTWLLASLLILSSCGKSFLDVKRNASQVVPKTIADYQAILDWNTVMNQTASFSLVCLGSDEYYLTDEVWNALSGLYIYQKNGYVWAKDVYEGAEVEDWNWAYQRILYANMALDVEKIKPTAQDQIAWNTVKGQALFFRAWTFYQLAQTFCKAYDQTTVDIDPGIPLTLDYDVTVKVGRGTLRETYERIIQDLKEAEPLLPATISSNFQPSKAAADALLARIYLELGDFQQGFLYCTNVLAFNYDLIDYNTLDLNNSFTFANYRNGVGNPEIIFYAHSNPGYALDPSMMKIDTNLFELYNEGDIRKNAFFSSDDYYKGTYNGDGNIFSGLAIDEVLLTRAECSIRMNDYQSATEDLNRLLKRRYRPDVFISLQKPEPSDLLDIILIERRKELFMRATRWTDLRRFNLHAETSVILHRKIEGVSYELSPNDPGWVWPLPDNEVELSDLKQNFR